MKKENNEITKNETGATEVVNNGLFGLLDQVNTTEEIIEENFIKIEDFRDFEVNMTPDGFSLGEDGELQLQAQFIGKNDLMDRKTIKVKSQFTLKEAEALVGTSVIFDNAREESIYDSETGETTYVYMADNAKPGQKSNTVGFSCNAYKDLTVSNIVLKPIKKQVIKKGKKVDKIVSYTLIVQESSAIDKYSNRLFTVEVRDLDPRLVRYFQEEGKLAETKGTKIRLNELTKNNNGTWVSYKAPSQPAK
jgi:hypothetical protein